MIVGIVRVELHIPEALSLKDKRSVLKSLKDQLHGRFNVAVAEVDSNEKWQRASLGLAMVGNDRRQVDGSLGQVTAWLRDQRGIAVIRADQELL